MTTTVDEIHSAIDRICAEQFKGIGRPAMILPGDKVSVSYIEGKPYLFMEMREVVRLACSILDYRPTPQE
jgi:hypothetical protein